MRLSRRDAAVALASLGFAGGASIGVWNGTRESTDGNDEDRAVRETLVAVATVVYPSSVTGVRTFVETYLEGRLDGDEHAHGLRQTVAELNDLADQWYGGPVASLAAPDRDRLLREVGADTAEEDPDGTVAERVRFYVVNDLLLALYTSPTGGELVGIENPQGHPGGIESYRRGPIS